MYIYSLYAIQFSLCSFLFVSSTPLGMDILIDKEGKEYILELNSSSCRCILSIVLYKYRKESLVV